MQIKKYDLFKTLKKTAKVNGLEISPDDNSRLFDFTLLNGLDMTDREKEALENDALKYVRASNPESFYGKEWNDFEWCSGAAIYYRHRVFGTDGKHKYTIFQLAKLRHYRFERNSTWEEAKCETVEAKCEYVAPLDDYEI